MRYYVMATGTAFGLLALAHIARVFVEGPHIASSPVFVVTTIGSIAFCAWAVWSLRRP